MTMRLVMLRAMSPIHAGTGMGEDVIDLPIAREASTGIPIIPGSSVKGVLRGLSRKEYYYGTVSRAGSMQWSDMYLVALPVRSIRGTFAYVTSPYLLQRFIDDYNICIPQQTPLIAYTVPPVDANGEYTAVIHQGDNVESSSLLAISENNVPQSVGLADLVMRYTQQDLSRIADAFNMLGLFPSTANQVVRRICLVHDTVMFYLMRTATEVRHRNALDENKTVKDGQLWLEEMLPRESIMAGIMRDIPRGNITQANLDEEVLAINQRKIVTFGGDTTTGHGASLFQIQRLQR
jgi:CRISPR-associated protein Cmr4